jgi:hypothetical protein
MPTKNKFFCLLLTVGTVHLHQSSKIISCEEIKVRLIILLVDGRIIANEKNLNAQSVGTDPRMYSFAETVEQWKGKMYGDQSKKECYSMRKN